MKAGSERRENQYDVFTSEDFRLLPVIGKGYFLLVRTIVPPVELQEFLTDDIYWSYYVMVDLSTYIIIRMKRT